MAFFEGKQKIKLITHGGNFHADEVFAVATISLITEREGKELEVVRTRDESEFEKADILVDVGMVCEPENFRFDHHQKGGAGFHFGNDSSKAEIKIPYASFGLVWKHFGESLCEDKEVAKKIEKKLVVPVDARDNGINIFKNLIEGVQDYSISRELVQVFRPTWRDAQEKSDQRFKELLEIFKKILENEIKVCRDLISGEKKVLEEINKQNQPEVLILKDNIFWDEVVSRFKNIKVVVAPESDTDTWSAECAKDDPKNFESDRVTFPENWWGLRSEELVEASGIHDAVFCHRNGFFAVAKSKESAILMAKKALG